MSGHSLQSPSEMKTNGFKASAGTPPLTKEQGDIAVSELYSKNLDKFPKIERKYADPIDHGQKFALVSFVPSKTAQPDEDGVYGMMKVRGVYASIDEADDRAEFLVRNVDSYQNILTTYVGRPFPLVQTGEKYGAELKEIDVEKKIEDKLTSRFFVASKDHKKFGEKVILVIEGEEMEISTNYFENLDEYETPKEIYFVPKFSETVNGKIPGWL